LEHVFTFNAEVKVSPAQILFGNAIILDRGIFLTHTIAYNDSIIPLLVWTSKMIHAYEEIIRISDEMQENNDLLQM